MEWQDQGILINTKAYGESSVIAEAFTREHGRCLGLVKYGRSKKNRTILQAGNILHLVWKARLAEHLGTYQVELIESPASDIMQSRMSLYGLQLLSAHLQLLAERQPHKELYHGIETILGYLARHEDPLLLANAIIRFELALLAELGFGLDLTSCVATGGTEELCYVSPKSGRAVSKEAGKPHEDKLFQLPEFLTDQAGQKPDISDLLNGARITGHFMQRDLWGPRRIDSPTYRQKFFDTIMNQAE